MVIAPRKPYLHTDGRPLSKPKEKTNPDNRQTEWDRRGNYEFIVIVQVILCPASNMKEFKNVERYESYTRNERTEGRWERLSTQQHIHLTCCVHDLRVWVV